jgi:hypothetical protein
MQSCFHKILPNTASNTQVINSQIEEILAKTPLIRQALLKINITEQCKNITNSLLDLMTLSSFLPIVLVGTEWPLKCFYLFLLILIINLQINLYNL